MKKLSVLPAALAVAIGSLAAPACSPKTTEIREDTHSAVTTTTAQTRNLSYHDIERLLKCAQQEEQNGRLINAAHAYSNAGDETKAKEMWLKYAQQEEQNGQFRNAASAYDHIGDKAKAKEMWLKYAQQEEQNGDFFTAIRAYEEVGNKAKAEELREMMNGTE